ncbi:MAG: ATP-binding protein [Acidimicrobiia bacterium]
MTAPAHDDLEPILLRIAAGARVVGAAWVGILVISAYLVAGDSMERPWLPITVATVVAGWSMLSVGWSGSRPGRLVSTSTLVVDIGLGAAALIATAFTGDGVPTYSGGLPLIVVAVASIRGRGHAWIAAVVMATITLVVRPGGVGEAVGSIVLYAAGAAIFTWIVRILRISDGRRRDADDLRRTAEAAAARAEERVEISRHLHDSVLQTLALIQRRAESAAAVTVLARQQERELREWLFGASPVEGSFSSALGAVASEAEVRYSIPVEVVMSGDEPLSEGGLALVAAAGEAITNAAAHSGAEVVSVFGEVTGDVIRVFVRDRGRGFDPEQLPEDRLGVRESILGRVHGRKGQATVRSEPGWGTEWRLEVPR